MEDTDRNAFVTEAKKHGLSKQNKLIARKAIRVELNKRNKEIVDLRKMTHDQLAAYFEKPNNSMEDRLFLKKCKNDRIAKVEKELDELEKDDQLLSRCPTLPPMLWGTSKNHTDNEKKDIMNKYMD